jgi:hypothetical protein
MNERLKKLKEEALEKARSFTDEENQELQVKEFEKAKRLVDGMQAAFRASDASISCVAMVVHMIEMDSRSFFGELWDEAREVSARQLKLVKDE